MIIVINMINMINMIIIITMIIMIIMMITIIIICTFKTWQHNAASGCRSKDALSWKLSKLFYQDGVIRLR